MGDGLDEEGLVLVVFFEIVFELMGLGWWVVCIGIVFGALAVGLDVGGVGVGVGVGTARGESRA